MVMTSFNIPRRRWSFLAVLALLSVNGEAFAPWEKTCNTLEDAKLELESCKNRFLQSMLPKVRSNGFESFCRHREDLMTCVEDMYTKLEICLTDTQIDDLKSFRQAIGAGLDFICYEDGTRIISFISEGGTMCFSSQLENFRECLKEMENEFDFAIGGHSKVFTEENCKIWNRNRHCLVKVAEKCEKKTPAKLLNSLIAEMTYATPCKSWTDPNGGTATIFTSVHDHLPLLLTMSAAVLITANML